MRDQYEADGALVELAFAAINLKGLEDHIEGYCTSTEDTILFPVLQDTAEAEIWSAYSALKDDVLVIDLREGAPGSIEAAWIGADSLLLYKEEDAAILKGAVDELLGL